jgi:hypothetical protein
MTRAAAAATLLAALVAACGGERADPPATDDTTAVAPPPPPPPAPISIMHERQFELTGDTMPETVKVIAIGSRYDSLAVRLEIRGTDGSALYAAEWPSALYFVYEDRTQMSDAEVLRRVRSHLQRLVHDSSYFDPRGTRGARPAIFQVDRDQIAYSVADRDWRDEHGFGDTLEIPSEAYNDIDADDANADRVSGLVAELLGMPAFRYYAGGEANYTVAWSPSERRFFTIWSCC